MKITDHLRLPVVLLYSTLSQREKNTSVLMDLMVRRLDVNRKWETREAKDCFLPKMY